MATAKWSTLDGVGFNKKHDALPHARSSSQQWPRWTGLRRRRLLLIAVAAAVTYLFIKNIPTNLAPVGQRYNSNYGSLAPGHVLAQAPLGHGKTVTTDDVDREQYDGTVYFQDLATTLRPYFSTQDPNRVLFVLSNAISTSILIPVACRMAQNNRSTVHVALLGRQDATFQDVVKLHGFSEKDCPIVWHDARIDRLSESSQARIAAGVQAGLGHCLTALRPSAVITDEIAADDVNLGGLLRHTIEANGLSLISLPANVLQTIPWMTALDGVALKKLKEVDIDIVIQAYPDSAGSLMRLLRSIEGANYHGLILPHLTIELPAQVDPLLTQFLAEFRWPPGSPPSQTLLTLRHRIRQEHLSSTDASIQTIESFYPKNPSNSHVLLLAPDAELSPDYLHYLMVTLLNYRYGKDKEGNSNSLVGISLELPAKGLDNQKRFLDNSRNIKQPLVMVQAPNSNAALFFGEKWVEFHSFLGHQLGKISNLKKESKSVSLVAKDYPSWLSQALDMMQARGQFMLYPAFAQKADLSIVTLHKELHQAPEEYLNNPSGGRSSKSKDESHFPDGDVLSNSFGRDRDKEKNVVASKMLSIQALLLAQHNSKWLSLPNYSNIPMFSHEGKATDWHMSKETARMFAREFMLSQGGCTFDALSDSGTIDSIDGLFCDNG